MSKPPSAGALVLVDVVLSAAPAASPGSEFHVTGHLGGFVTLDEAAAAAAAYNPNRPPSQDPADLLKNLRLRADGRFAAGQFRGDLFG